MSLNVLKMLHHAILADHELGVGCFCRGALTVSIHVGLRHGAGTVVYVRDMDPSPRAATMVVGSRLNQAAVVIDSSGGGSILCS